MGAMRQGISPVLEAEANRMLRESMKGITKHSAKSDILTPWKQQERYRREVYTPTGVADATSRRGIFGRVTNTTRPELNSRDGVVRAAPRGRSTLAAFVENNGSGFLEDMLG